MLGRNKLQIEFFTEHEELLDHPPVPAAKAMPEWFRKMPPSHPVEPNQRFPFGISSRLRLSNVNATVRRCPGIVGYLAHGYIVPLWSDFVVQVRPNAIYAFGSNATAQVSLHSRKLHFLTMPPRPGYYPDAVKFTNPWKVRAPRGYSVMVSAPFYHFEDRFQIVPGIVEADTYHQIHVNTFFRAEEADHELKMGSPFLLVTPFRREEAALTVRSATAEDVRRLRRARFRSDRFFAKNQAIRRVENEGED